MGYRIAQLTDTHLGYAAPCRTNPDGINARVADGYTGFAATIDAILAAGVDLVLHGGDLFHRSAPNVADIVEARRGLERLAAAGIPVIAVTGNHDHANDRGKAPATAAVHDPARGITMVTDPLAVLHPADGIAIHAVSHVGLLAATRTTPTPQPGALNVLLTHGAVEVPGHAIFATVDSPGEAVLPYDTLTAGWHLALLGHYHGQGALPGFDKTGRPGQAWYGGSLLRRGFSDPAGARGWLLVDLDDTAVTVTPQPIAQRPQHDLPVVDAAGLTATEVEDAIRAHLASVELTDAIVRQKVINAPLATRRGIDHAALAALAAPALMWMPEFTRPQPVEDPADLDPLALPANLGEAALASLATARAADLPGMFSGWYAENTDRLGIPPAAVEPVRADALALLAQVSATVEHTTDAATSALTAGEAA